MSTLTNTPVRHRVEHRRVVAARPAVLYDLVADVTRWPAIFGPSVDVRLLAHSAAGERFEIWALVNDEVARWTSRRTFDPAGLEVGFAQEKSQAPVAAMSGRWSFRPVADGTEILLVHEFAAVGDDPAHVEWIRRALERNSPAELAALARVAEFGEPLEDLVFSFTDTIEVPAAAADTYEFVDRADLWAERLPHVAKSDLRQDPPGVQYLDMETRTADGGTHTTSSVRLCTPGERIVFKQRMTPKLMIGHTGEWLFADTPAGSTVTVTHTVALDPTAVEDVLGPGGTLADARAWATEALRQNSRTTVSYARVFAEGRRTVPSAAAR